MKKKVLAISLLTLLSTACEKNDSTTADTATPVSDSASETASSPATTPATTPVPTEAITFDTSGVTLNSATAAQEEKVDKALEIIRKVVASEEFKDAVINFTYNGKKQFVDNGGYTNEEIYQKILDAAEEKYPARNNRMDMDVTFYYNAFTSTVGYTTSGSTGINVNTKFFNGYNATGVADNLFHEWLHKLGFTHASSYSVSRDSSVPYALGYLIERLGKQYL